jgi:alanine-glyoxylate transaminase / (R)-3-amino-2-methylpropionate-pyruvate transaminase
LLGKGGIEGNVLRIKPPLCVTREDAEFLAGVVGECLDTLNH